MCKPKKLLGMFYPNFAHMFQFGLAKKNRQLAQALDIRYVLDRVDGVIACSLEVG